MENICFLLMLHYFANKIRNMCQNKHVLTSYMHMYIIYFAFFLTLTANKNVGMFELCTAFLSLNNGIYRRSEEAQKNDATFCEYLWVYYLKPPTHTYASSLWHQHATNRRISTGHVPSISLPSSAGNFDARVPRESVKKSLLQLKTIIPYTVIEI